MTTTSPPAAPSAPTGETHRWLALTILCVGFLMVILDQTIVNVALPTIHHSLGFSQSGLAWVVDAYLIGFGALLMLAGRLGDLLGRRSVFLVGLVVFTLGSLWCGLSGSQIAARHRPLRSGRRRRGDRRSPARNDRPLVPGARQAGQGDRRLRRRRLPPAARSDCCSAAS